VSNWRLIAGLGNPGASYEGSRHNVGFDVVASLARRHAPGELARARFSGTTVEGSIDGARVLLLRPGTWMNLSGQSVQEAVQFYKLDVPSDVLVIVDDLALPCGTVRLRAEGSDGGHNGLADVTRRLGTDRYARLRVGIDGPGDVPQAAYVLGRFRPDQQPLVDQALSTAAEAAAYWVTHGIEETMNRFNRKQSA